MNSKTTIRATLPFLLLILASTGCKGRNEAASAGPAGGKPPVAVEVRTATLSEIVEGVDVTGTLSPKFSADVKAEIPGRIEEVLVTEWVSVRKGTPLARVDTRDIELRVNGAQAALEAARAALAEAETAAARAERERSRMTKLKEFGLATPQEWENVETEAASAASRVESARARVRVSEEDLAVTRRQVEKALVVSPLDGVVASRSVNVGDLPGDKPIFHVVDNRVLELTVTVPTGEMARIRPEQTLTFTTEALPGRTFAARVSQINPSVNPSDRTLGVLAEVRNASGELRGGLFVKGRILTGSPRRILQVPRSALSEWDLSAGTANLLTVDGTTARRRKVATGAASGDLVEIVSGLSAGETYILRGGFLVKDGDTVNPIAGKEG